MRRLPETLALLAAMVWEVRLFGARVFPVGAQLNRGIAFAALVDQHIDHDLDDDADKQKNDHQLNDRKALHALHMVSSEIRRAPWYAKPGRRGKPGKP